MSKIHKYRIKFNGIYEMGPGFLSMDIANKWHDFWANHFKIYSKRLDKLIDPIYWRFVPPEDTYRSGNIITTGSNIYLDGMQMDYIHEEIGSSGDGKDHEFEELREILDRLVAHIGNGVSWTYKHVLLPEYDWRALL